MKLSDLIDAYVIAAHADGAAQSRLAFWDAQLGNKVITDVSDADVDAAMAELARRGRLDSRGQSTGQPLAPSTLNRYQKTLAQVYAFAKRERILRRSFTSPTAGAPLAPEKTHHDRFFSEDEIELLIKVAGVADHQYGQLPTIILFAAHTGLRKANILQMRWGQIDLENRTAIVPVTKNHQPIVVPLSQELISAFGNLRGDRSDKAWLFPGRAGRCRDIRKTWSRTMRLANLTGRTFHSLRHSFGYQLAKAGVNQSVIMMLMGHRSLAASARYMHMSTNDRLDVVDRVFSGNR